MGGGFRSWGCAPDAGLAISLFGSALLRVLHTALCSEGGGYGRKDGDENVEDFTPGGIIVESSHSVKVGF